VPYDSDGMRRWESFLFITNVLRAYVTRKPLAARTEPVWPHVVALASQHLVSPAVGIVLLRERSVPDGVKDYFSAVVALNRERNRVLEIAIREAVLALNRSRIIPLLLKGGANLLEGVYRDPAARIMGDIDMLVPAGRAAAASGILKAAGFTAAELKPPPQRRWVSTVLSPHHLARQVSVNSGAGIELHHELVHRQFLRLINATGALARADARERDGLRPAALPKRPGDAQYRPRSAAS
jgi:hypothetical protein